MPKEFPIEDVLSVTTGTMVGSLRGVVDIIGYLFGGGTPGSIGVMLLGDSAASLVVRQNPPIDWYTGKVLLYSKQEWLRREEEGEDLRDLPLNSG